MRQATSEFDYEATVSAPVSPKRTVLWAAELCERLGVSPAVLVAAARRKDSGA